MKVNNEKKSYINGARAYASNDPTLSPVAQL